MAKTVLRRPLPVALLAGTVIVAGALTCTQGPANGSDLRRQAWADAPPSQAFALRALSKLLAKGWSSAMAALPDGYDAATWDQAGHIQFWEQAGALPWSRATSC
ncbi:MAG TPA: hypothetical protein VFN61_12640, partial [Acidimicrobiales bacterium]|nr:hypothetical protein [Acidimicrobiales bacterium]